MNEQFERTSLIFGEDYINKIEDKCVAVFGVGGVGGYVCEALARTGINHFVLIDNDTVSISNINRQIIATYKTIGMPKVEVMKDRILDINPKAYVETIQKFYSLKTKEEFDFTRFDYIVDAVDTVTAKIDIIVRAKELNIPIISSMGTGNKVDPTKFKIADIGKTTTCPLAKTMRYELRKRNINHVKVLFSDEIPVQLSKKIFNEENNKQIPGSSAFCPSVAGLIIASEVMKDLLNNTKEE